MRTLTGLLLAVAVLLSFPAAAQESAPAAEPAAADPARQTIDRLAELRRQALDKRRELDELRRRLKSTTQEEQRQEIERQLAELPKSIERLNQSFTQIAVGGVDPAVFAEQPPEVFDWKAELLEITRPLLGSLKDLTAKPRKLERLRSEALRYQEQLDRIGAALAHIAALQTRQPPAHVAERLARLDSEWRQGQIEAANALELVRYQIATVEGQNASVWQALAESGAEFLHGRGLTLGLALATVVAVWLLARLLLWVVQKSHRAGSRRERARWNRIVFYAYRAGTVAVALLGVLVVFYVRGDLLLLALLLLGLFMLAVSLRQTLPKYVEEIRLLLDFGAIREGERVIHDGVPMEVKAIRTFATLKNPELEGVVRLPLGALSSLVSRPGADEPWFPTVPGDFVLLGDGRVAEVQRQTVEQVLLRVGGAPLRFATADFIAQDFRNLSRGFGIPVTFGIDYAHQAICLDEVPAKLYAGVAQAFADAGRAAEVLNLLVEFKEAGANSLDYLIYVTLDGRAGGAYFAIGRLIQRACVAVCNREGWVIPFAQLTLHQGEGFDGLRSTP